MNEKDLRYRFDLPEGSVYITIPNYLSLEALTELSDWFTVILRSIDRRAKEKESQSAASS